MRPHRKPAVVAAAAGQGKPDRISRPLETNSSAGAVEAAVVMVAVVAAAAIVVDLLWEILARFAPGSETLCEP